LVITGLVSPVHEHDIGGDDRGTTLRNPVYQVGIDRLGPERFAGLLFCVIIDIDVDQPLAVARRHSERLPQLEAVVYRVELEQANDAREEPLQRQHCQQYQATSRDQGAQRQARGIQDGFSRVGW